MISQSKLEAATLSAKQPVQIVELDAKLEPLLDDIVHRYCRSQLMALARIRRSSPSASRLDGVSGDIRKRRVHHARSSSASSGVHGFLVPTLLLPSLPAAPSGPCPRRSDPSPPAGNPPFPEAARG
jgi:hypothetical protein